MTQANAFMELLISVEPPELGPGPRAGVLSQGELDKRMTLLLKQQAPPRITQQLVQSLLLLWHDHLDFAHTIAQGIENPDGSLVHAMIHRREPDYWNSKYWWRRVGQYPCWYQFQSYSAGSEESLEALPGADGE